MAKKGKKVKVRSTVVGTVLGMSLILFTMGGLALGVYAWNIFETKAKESTMADVWFRQNANEQDVLRMSAEISSMSGIREAVYVSPDSAQALMMERMGEESFDILDGAQAFKPSVNIKFDAEYINIDSVESLKKKILASNPELIESMDYNKKQFAEVSDNFSNLKYPILLIALVLLSICVILIYNTIRLAVFSKRFTIKTMQLVGAKSNFIRRPFLLDAIWQGMISGILAIILLMLFGFIMGKISMQWVDILVQQFEIVSQNWIPLASILLGIILLGIFISFVSTYFALNKYIWIKTDKLY